jgi:hypothetical protein
MGDGLILMNAMLPEAKSDAAHLSGRTIRRNPF